MPIEPREKLLQELQRLAGLPASELEIALQLGFESVQVFSDYLEQDKEVRDIWVQARRQMFFDIKNSLLNSAKNGSPAAVRAVQSFLESETLDLTDWFVTTTQLAALMGKSTATILGWSKQYGLEQEQNHKWDLRKVFTWLDGFYRKKYQGTRGNVGLSSLQKVKKKMLDLDLQAKQGVLLPSSQVRAGFVARYERLRLGIQRGLPTLIAACQGKSGAELQEILGRFFNDLLEQQTEELGDLQLSPEATVKFREFLKLLGTKT